MGRKQATQARPCAEQHVADFLGVGGLQVRVLAVATDLLQCIGDACCLPCELYRGGIGQEFALTGYAGLDQSSHEHANAAEYCQPEPDDDRASCVPAPAVGTAAQDHAADQTEHHDAEEDAHETYVQAHVAIEDVAALVPDDALQFVAVQCLQRAARHGNGRIARLVTRCERIDAAFLLEYVNLRHGRARRDRHFLDDVTQPAAQWILHVGGHGHAAQGNRNAAAARRQNRSLVQGRTRDQERRGHRGADQNGGLIASETADRVKRPGNNERHTCDD